MRRGVCARGVSGCGMAALAVGCVLVGSSSAFAQSTLTLDAPTSEVVYATIRGGTYANENLPTTLETRASTDPEYLRRALLKFDTDSTLPQGTPIVSAVLTVTVQDSSADASRTIGAYPVTTSWTETEVTWNDRRTGQKWTTAGGDLGSLVSTEAVSNVVGSKVSFDVTSLVQQVVSGKLGSSRYTRIALLDNGDSTHDSWRSYYTPDATTASLRPTLTVLYGTTAVAPPPATSTSTSTSACSVALSAPSMYVGDGQANWTLNVSAASTCAWSAASDQTWLVVKSTSPAPGSGAGSIKLRADANTTSSTARAGHVQVNGLSYTVTQEGCGSSCTGTTTTTTPPPTGTTLRVLQWNTHHGGIGTDGVWSPSRLVQYIASFKPDVVSLNEMEYKDSYTGGTDEPATIASLLKTATGKTWYYKFAVGSGAATGIGNMLLSSIPFDAVSTHLLTADRVIVNGSITVNGRTVNVFSTHLDDASSTNRLAEIADLVKWATGFVEQRVICGDFNAWPGTAEQTTMQETYIDSWAQAQTNGTAIAYPGNTAGNTRNTRIDYIFYSKGATDLALVSSQVYNVADANGIMPSDHRPVLTTFVVK